MRPIAACRTGPKSMAELMPVLFRRQLDAHQLPSRFPKCMPTSTI
ncbi:hypothetical protein [Oryzicola mucosus]